MSTRGEHSYIEPTSGLKYLAYYGGNRHDVGGFGGDGR
jgi:hypothetical protein